MHYAATLEAAIKSVIVDPKLGPSLELENASAQTSVDKTTWTEEEQGKENCDDLGTTSREDRAIPVKKISLSIDGEIATIDVEQTPDDDVGFFASCFDAEQVPAVKRLMAALSSSAK